MSDPVADTMRLAQSYGLDAKDCGNGHVQISGHGNLVNYYPASKKRSLWCPTLNRRETNCTPWDAVKLCMTEAKPGMKPKAAKEVKNVARVDLAPAKTNPADLKHFYEGETPPWDESLGEFQVNAESDALRIRASRLDDEATALRAEANDMDEAAQEPELNI